MMTTDTKEVATQIKNKELVKERRRQIVDAAVPLFIERGYHKTTTRALAHFLINTCKKHKQRLTTAIFMMSLSEPATADSAQNSE